jgi:hypothetical protein
LPIVNAVLAEDIEQKPIKISPYLVEEPQPEHEAVGV